MEFNSNFVRFGYYIFTLRGVILRGPSFLSFDDDDGFKLSVLPGVNECSYPFYLLTFGKMLKEKHIETKDDRHYLIYSLRGRGEAFINGEWSTVDEGDLVYFPAGSKIDYRPASDDEWSTIFFCFNGRSVVSTMGNEGFIVREGDFSFIPDMLSELRANYSRDDFKEFAFSKLYYLILILKRYAPKAKIGYPSPDVSNTVAKSIKHIHEQFTADLPISEIAEVSGVTREYFCKLFKEQTGQTCTSYINELRINKACDLIMQDSSKRIEDISTECGFRTVSYFNRVFKQKTGISPGEYRQKISE